MLNPLTSAVQPASGSGSAARAYVQAIAAMPWHVSGIRAPKAVFHCTTKLDAERLREASHP